MWLSSQAVEPGKCSSLSQPGDDGLGVTLGVMVLRSTRLSPPSGLICLTTTAAKWSRASPLGQSALPFLGYTLQCHRGHLRRRIIVVVAVIFRLRWIEIIWWKFPEISNIIHCLIFDIEEIAIWHAESPEWVLVQGQLEVFEGLSWRSWCFRYERGREVSPCEVEVPHQQGEESSQ